MLIIIIFILGAVAASAIICARYRRWGYASSLFTPSHCDYCCQRLSWIKLMPIVGWYINLGRCSTCQHSISLIYPMTELAAGLWAVVIFKYALINNVPLIIMCILITTGIIFLFIIDDDINDYRIRDHHTLIIAVAGLTLEGQYLTSLLMGGLLWLTACLYRLWRKYDCLGYGDVKLVFALGAWLPITAIPYYFTGIGSLGIIWGALWRHRQQSEIFPYGPVLIISFISLYVFGLARFTNCGILKEILLWLQG